MTGADNQQERLGSAEAAKWFLAGFIEGEGALCVSIKKHPTCRSGFYVDPEFFLYQHESGRLILELAQETFGSGQIYPKSRQSKSPGLRDLVYSHTPREGLALLRTVRRAVQLQKGDVRAVPRDPGFDGARRPPCDGGLG